MRQFNVGKWVCFISVAFSIASEVQASDLSEFLWGGRGSRTTVTDPYIPPPLMTETPFVPVMDAGAPATMQSNLMLGTPGATTLPSGGVIAANGVASSGVISASYVWPNSATTASNIIPAVQVSPAQPVIDYEWTYSTIKDVTYEQVSVYDPRLGGYVTTWQEKHTESVLPWLHRKQVVRYTPASADATMANTVIGGTTIGSPLAPVASDTSERRIVNRLFPVSTVPSPPAQAVPVQTVPLSASQMTTYVAEQPAATTVMRIGELPIVPAVTIQPQSVQGTLSTNAPINVSAADVHSVPQDQSAPISSSQADLPPSLPQVVSPSSQQVLYPTVPTDHPTQSSNMSSTTTPSNTTSGTARSGSPSGTPTLAPPKPDAASGQTPTGQETFTLQQPLLEDSIFASEKPGAVELPPGSPLPPPAQAPAIPTLDFSSPTASTNTPASSNTTNGGIPLLTTDTPSSAQPATLPATRTPSTTRTPLRRNVSPTRMVPQFN